MTKTVEKVFQHPQGRQHCIIVQGLKECTSVSSDHNAEDMASFNRVLNDLFEPGLEFPVLKSFRIGKKPDEATGTPRPRPLKIVMQNDEHVKLILSKKTSLRQSHKEVFFQPEYSLAERLKRRELVAELLSRRKNGETSLEISNGKIIHRNMRFLNQPIILRTMA